MKKILLVLIAVLALSCSKDDESDKHVYDEEVTILDHGWINGHKRYYEPAGGEVWEFEMFAEIENNTQFHQEGYILFYPIDTSWNPIRLPANGNDFITIKSGETKRFSRLMRNMHEYELYETGYGGLEFIYKYQDYGYEK